MKVEIRAKITLDEDEQFDFTRSDGKAFRVAELRASISEPNQLFGRGLWLNKDGSISASQSVGGAFGTVPIAALPRKVRDGLCERSLLQTRYPKTDPKRSQSFEARRQAMLG